MPETTPLIKAALNLTAGAGFDVYKISIETFVQNRENISPVLALKKDAFAYNR